MKYIFKHNGILYICLLLVLMGITFVQTHAQETLGNDADGFTVSGIIGDGMIFQADEPICIWGTSKDEGKVVYAKFGNSYGQGIVQNGIWEIFFAPRSASLESLTLEVYASENAPYKVYEDILIGEVWWVIGQSNVEYRFGSLAEYEQIADSISDMHIRYFNFDTHELALACRTNQTDVGYLALSSLPNVVWRSGSHGENAAASAIGLCFAKELCTLSLQRVPIGVVCLGFGGKELSAFLPEELAKDLSGLEEKSVVYDHFIAPLERLAVGGVVWYQGEANAAYYSEYADALTSFIFLLRNNKCQESRPDFPFLISELPPSFDAPDGTDHTRWQYIDYGSVRAASGTLPMSVPECYICPTLDLWNNRSYTNNLHPTNKPQTAARLARIAASRAFGFSEFEVLIAPSVKEYSMVDDKGLVYDLVFEHAYGGLDFAGGTPLGFDAVGGDWNPIPVTVSLVGANTVRIVSETERIHLIRYAYATDSVFGETVSLCNGASIPAAAFCITVCPIEMTFPAKLYTACVKLYIFFYPYRFVILLMLLCFITLIATVFVKRKRKKADLSHGEHL